MTSQSRRRRVARRTVVLQRNGRAIKVRLLVPTLELPSHDPLLASLGAYAEEPLWEALAKEMAASREAENEAA